LEALEALEEWGRSGEIAKKLKTDIKYVPIRYRQKNGLLRYYETRIKGGYIGI